MIKRCPACKRRVHPEDQLCATCGRSLVPATDLDGIVELPVGQTESLTDRLHGLIRDYPKGVGIVKEFIQNADDARATKVEIVLDLRTHGSEQLPAPKMAKLSGPALLIYNDRTFTDEDFANIQQIGQSAKILTMAKTGRFGL